MRIALATPFKPLDHHRLSGDVTIARDLAEALEGYGHEVVPAPFVPSGRIWEHPERWPALLAARRRVRRMLADNPPDAWLTYNSYYKAPDLLGPMAARADVPYVVFSAAYAEKRREQPQNRPGYLLNKRALLAADHLFLNKRDDLATCSRLVDEARRTFVRPGIPTHRFEPAPEARERLRAEWGVGPGPVAVSAAVLRPGVKVQGVEWTIRALGRLVRNGLDISLVIAGDGEGRAGLEELARAEVPGRVRFLGMVDRDRLHEVYSAGDFFVFPGIDEGLGMVYLEAQCCGLPCVAFDHMGAPEVVAAPHHAADHLPGRAGFITPSFDMDAFASAMRTLAEDGGLRRNMGARARRFVLDKHDASGNYRVVERTMLELVRNAATRSLRS